MFGDWADLVGNDEDGEDGVYGQGKREWSGIQMPTFVLCSSVVLGKSSGLSPLIHDLGVIVHVGLE